jgi:hypothetical protein
MLHRRLIYQRLAFFADAMYAVFVTLDHDAGRLAALGADQHNVRDVKRGFKFQATGVNGTTLRLDGLLVLGMDIQALDNQARLVRQYFNYLAALTLLLDLPADNFNGITFTDLNFHFRS